MEEKKKRICTSTVNVPIRFERYQYCPMAVGLRKYSSLLFRDPLLHS